MFANAAVTNINDMCSKGVAIKGSWMEHQPRVKGPCTGRLDLCAVEYSRHDIEAWAAIPLLEREHSVIPQNSVSTLVPFRKGLPGRLDHLATAMVVKEGRV